MARLTLTAKMAWSMWQTNRGFSLVEVLVAVMVTGIAMVMVSRFMQNFYRSQAAVEAAASVDEELNRFVKQLKTRWSQRAAPIDPATQMPGEFTLIPSERPLRTAGFELREPGKKSTSFRKVTLRISKMDPASGAVTDAVSFIRTGCDPMPNSIKPFYLPSFKFSSECQCAVNQIPYVDLNDRDGDPAHPSYPGLGLNLIRVPSNFDTPGTKIQSLSACFSWDGARPAADRDARGKDAFHDLKVELEATYLGPGNKIFSTKRTVMLPINSPHKTATFLLK